MKILIVEDNFIIADAYRSHLKMHHIICDIAQTYNEALKKILNGNYDIALLDINLPCRSGVELLKEIRLNNIPIGIIMVTARTEEELIINSLDNGADDYLQKPIRYNELISRINAVYRRLEARTTSNLQVKNIEIDYTGSLIYINQQLIKMTNKEFLIISKLCQLYPGYCSTHQLNNALYDEYEISSATIRVHIYNLKKKLEPHLITIENNKNLGYILCFPQ